MRLACSAASFPADPLDRAIQKAAWAEYDGVELVLDTDTLPDEEELRQRLTANELELAAVWAGELPAAVGDSTDEAGMKALARIGRAAALAHRLNGALMVVTAPAEGDVAGLAASLTLLDLALGGAEIPVCLVNRPGTLLASPEDFASLWQADLPLRAGIALDPGAAQDAGWDPAALDQLPALPGHVYLTDRRSGRPVPVGEGEVHLSAVVDALKVRGYSSSLSLRLEGADPWAVEPVVKEIRELAEAWLG